MGECGANTTRTERLLEQAMAGDADAFGRLVEPHRPALLDAIERRLDHRLLPRVDASDVVQEAQLEAFRRLGDFFDRRPMPFRLWLLKTAHERLLKLVRRHLDAAKRTLRREVPLPDRSSILLARRLVAGGPTPSAEAHRLDPGGLWLHPGRGRRVRGRAQRRYERGETQGADFGSRGRGESARQDRGQSSLQARVLPARPAI